MLADVSENLRRMAAAISRIESTLTASSGSDEELIAIRRGVDRAGQSIDGLSTQWAAAFEKSSRVTQEQLARTLGSLKDALELLHVSMDQGNALYRSIIKKIVPYSTVSDDSAAA